MAGLYISGKSKVSAKGAKLTGNAGGGAVVKDGSYANLDEANVSNNYGHGVSVDNSEVSAVNAIIENNGVERIYSDLGIDPKFVNQEQLQFIINQAIDKKCEKTKSGEILEVLSHTAIFATIASADPIVAAVSAVLSCSMSTLKQYKSFFK